MSVYKYVIKERDEDARKANGYDASYLSRPATALEVCVMLEVRHQAPAQGSVAKVQSSVALCRRQDAVAHGRAALGGSCISNQRRNISTYEMRKASTVQGVNCIWCCTVLRLAVFML